MKAAREAFENGPWSQMTASERGRLIWKLADLIEQHLEEFARARIARQRQAADGRARGRCAAGGRSVPLHGGMGDEDRGQHDSDLGPYTPGAKYLAYTLREPVGVVGQIIPWNFPAADGGVEAGPGAGDRLHGRAEAGRADAAVLRCAWAS